MIEYNVRFYNGAAWFDGGTYSDERAAFDRYNDYVRRYGKAELYKLITTFERIR